MRSRSFRRACSTIRQLKNSGNLSNAVSLGLDFAEFVLPINERKFRDIRKPRKLVNYSWVPQVSSLNFGKNKKFQNSQGTQALFNQQRLLYPDGLPEVNHLNGCKTDNQVTNLKWSSSSDNVIHTYRTKIHQTKLNPEMVLKIPEYRKSGMTLREVGKLLGVSHSTIWEIEQGLIYEDIAWR